MPFEFLSGLWGSLLCLELPTGVEIEFSMRINKLVFWRQGGGKTE